MNRGLEEIVVDVM